MATIKLKLRTSAASPGEGTLFFQITHRRVVRQIHTGYRISVLEWNADTGEFVYAKEAGNERRRQLGVVEIGVRNALSTLERVVLKLVQTGRTFTADEIIAAYTDKVRTGGFFRFVRKHKEHLVRCNRLSAARKVQTTLNSLSNFIGHEDIAFEQLDENLFEQYAGWLKGRGICMNTSAFYMRTLRIMYNIAVQRGLTDQRAPFKHVYTGMDKTVKRAVPVNIIKKIYHMDLSDAPSLDFARNIFLLSFYLRGMSFVDICFLKKSDLKDGILSYRRQKTGQLLQIRWEKQMQRLLDTFGKSSTEYLLPIITDTEDNGRIQYESALRRVNRNLKRVGQLVGLETVLTTYVARHSWAAAAQGLGISIETISEGLGHDSVHTTKIYLKSITASVVDQANSSILRLMD